MKTPFDSPALFLQSERYPLAWEGKVPKQVCMVKKAICIPLCVGKIWQPIAQVGTLFGAWVDWNGAVSALFESGETLALKPEEFRVVEWHERAHYVL
jgi:hypothetical protein